MNLNEISPISNPWLNQIQKNSVYLRNIFLASAVGFGVIGVTVLMIKLGAVRSELTYSLSLNSMGDALECWFAYKLFSLYAKCDLFSADAVRWLRWIGILSVLRGCSNLWVTLHGRVFADYFQRVQVSPSVTRFVLDLDLFFSHLVHNLVFGFVVILIAWIMDEGRKIQEEQALTV